MKNYYRVMLGPKSIHAADCFAGGFIGVDFSFAPDLTGKLPEEWRQFNKEFIPLYLKQNPTKSKISAGLACGALWTVSKGIQKGDIVLCPDGTGIYHVGELTGDYYYAAGQILPHRRPVQWLPIQIARADMSEALRNSTGSIGTVSQLQLQAHSNEIEQFLAQHTAPVIIVPDPTVEDPVAFALEKHLEDFLVKNWQQTELAKDFTIFEEDGNLVGQQYNTDAGPIDILAISKDKKRLLVIELKRGRASDAVVGQILRYMGFVRDQIAEPGQAIEGAIIALEDDKKLQWLLSLFPQYHFSDIR